MLACVDVDYRVDHALAACVVFGDWGDGRGVAEHTVRVEPVEPYVPGEFYRRELPCVLEVLGLVKEPLEVVVIDGYVWLDGQGKAGLVGGHLYERLGRKVPVVGVAKTRFEQLNIGMVNYEGVGFAGGGGWGIL